MKVFRAFFRMPYLFFLFIFSLQIVWCAGFHVFCPSVHRGRHGRVKSSCCSRDGHLSLSYTTWPQSSSLYKSARCTMDTAVCVLYIKLFFPPVYIQHNQCPCQTFNLYVLGLGSGLGSGWSGKRNRRFVRTCT